MDIVKQHIDTFNNLHGKTVRKEQLKKLLANVKKANNSGLAQVEEKLQTVINKMNGKPVLLNITPITYTKVVKDPEPTREIKRSLPPVKRTVSNKVTKEASTSKQKKIVSLNGVVDASAIGALSFTKIDLDGKYKNDFLRMFSDTQIMIWGMPGGGKTVYLLYLAQYLAEKKNQRVLFMANEEMNRSTLTEKINEFKIGNKNLKFAQDFNSLKVSNMSIDDFDVVIFDSVQSLGFTLESYKKFVKQNPGRIYILVAQSTKDGDFRGGKDWEHEVDIAGEICNRKLILRKNRLDSDFAKKSDKLLMNEKVQEGKKRLAIKEQIKSSVKKEEVVAPKTVTV